MKKTLTLFILFLMVLSQVRSQEVDLPTDENNRYVFYEVIDANGFDSTTLLKNAEAFLKYYVNKKSRMTIRIDEKEGKATAISSFLVYKKGSLGKHVDGAIEYSITIEVKDQRYRYILTDFYFQEYQRNRYGKFVPEKGKSKPLEQPASKLGNWQWEAHKLTVKEKMEMLINELKLEMVKVENKKKSKVHADKW